MNDKLNIVLILNVLCASAFAKNVRYLGDGEDFKDQVYGNSSEDSSNLNPGWVAEITPTIYQNVKRYYCSGFGDAEFDFGSDSQSIIFTTNEWRFPSQDVNLTLSYPTNNEESKYWITSSEIFLFYDGRGSCQGYLTDGGMGQDKITMEFIIPNTTRLYYQFRLQGVEKTGFYKKFHVNSTQICNQDV